MSTTIRQKSRFDVGDWVTFPFATRQIHSRVIEDRGPIGIGGQQLYRIRTFDLSGEPTTAEIPESDLTVAEIDKSQAMQALIEGGLVDMLKRNLGGSPPPRAWLTFGPQGKIIPTYVPERGVKGGKPIPSWAISEDRIFGPKVEEVVDFLSCFDLNRAEAEQVIRSVGVFP